MSIERIVNSRRLVKNIRLVIDDVSTSLPNENIQDAIELLEYREWGCALSLICAQLYEYDIKISHQTYVRIERVGQQMKMPSTEWTMLKELVR